MLYYYAHTGHKVGLERLRRGVALKHALQKHGIEMQMLVNDFRAGVAMKDEQGLAEYITIETIQDIDAVAQIGDSVIIDSNEDDHGRLVKYVSDFKQVWRFAHDKNDTTIHGEILFKADCNDADCEEAVIIDESYFEKTEKEARVLFFLRDYDHDKTILNHTDFFSAFEMELLLGHYFFVKYEKDLAKLFTCLHEPEEYTELISRSSTVVTASSQAAMEARASGAKVIFIDLGTDMLYTVEELKKYGIVSLSGFDIEGMKSALTAETSHNTEMIKQFDENHLLKKL